MKTPGKLLILSLGLSISILTGCGPNYSIEEQTERLKAYCKAKDWAVYKFYTDAGYSGGNTNRPALKQIFKDYI